MHCGKAFLTVLLTVALMGMGWMSAAASSTDAVRLGESDLGRLGQGDSNRSLFADGLSLAVSRGAGTKEVVGPRGSLGRQAVAASIEPTLTVTHPVGLALATHFVVSYTEIMDWHQQGLGFGGIAKAYFLADELGAGTTVTGVFSLKLTGTGWGPIFKEYGLSPSGRNRSLGQVMSGRGHGGGSAPEETSLKPEEDESVLKTRRPNKGKAQDKVPPGQDKGGTAPGQNRNRIPPGQDRDKGKGKGNGGGKP
jgi:hypothetical protein